MPDRAPKKKPGGVQPNEFNEAKRSAFLLALVESGSIRGASARAGVNFSTVYRAAREDEHFRGQIDAARGEFEQSALQAIMKAGVQGDVIERRRGGKIIKPGDWRALAWLLEHSPAYRDNYAGILRQKIEVGQSPELLPMQVEHDQTTTIEIGPDTMERLAAVVQILLRAGKLRLPDPNENVIDGDAADA